MAAKQLTPIWNGDKELQGHYVTWKKAKDSLLSQSTEQNIIINSGSSTPAKKTDENVNACQEVSISYNPLPDEPQPSTS